MTKDELMGMARDAQVIGSDDSLECFANAILERAAAECDRLKLMYTNMAEDEDENFSTSELTSRYWGNVSALSGAGYDIRALKIKEGE